MKVKLNGKLIPAHRFVLAARSEHWGVPSLVEVDFLGNMSILFTLIVLLRIVESTQFKALLFEVPFHLSPCAVFKAFSILVWHGKGALNPDHRDLTSGLRACAVNSFSLLLYPHLTPAYDMLGDTMLLLWRCLTCQHLGIPIGQLF
jgi:hypothetical protein